MVELWNWCRRHVTWRAFQGRETEKLLSVVRLTSEATTRFIRLRCSNVFIILQGWILHFFFMLFRLRPHSSCKLNVHIKIYILPGWKWNASQSEAFPVSLFYDLLFVVILAIVAGSMNLADLECVSCLINNFYDTSMSYYTQRLFVERSHRFSSQVPPSSHFSHLSIDLGQVHSVATTSLNSQVVTIFLLLRILANFPDKTHIVRTTAEQKKLLRSIFKAVSRLNEKRRKKSYSMSHKEVALISDFRLEREKSR